MFLLLSPGVHEKKSTPHFFLVPDGGGMLKPSKHKTLPNAHFFIRLEMSPLWFVSHSDPPWEGVQVDFSFYRVISQDQVGPFFFMGLCSTVSPEEEFEPVYFCTWRIEARSLGL